jgi:hypothetical protein
VCVRLLTAGVAVTTARGHPRTTERLLHNRGLIEHAAARGSAFMCRHAIHNTKSSRTSIGIADTGHVKNTVGFVFGP